MIVAAVVFVGCRLADTACVHVHSMHRLVPTRKGANFQQGKEDKSRLAPSEPLNSLGIAAINETSQDAASGYAAWLDNVQ